MITINIPTPDLLLTKSDFVGEHTGSEISSVYGFTDYMKIPRDKGGIFMFYNMHDELLYVGKARKLRQRIKKNFEDTSSLIKNHRDEVYEIAICYVDEAMDREIYETYIINKQHAKYNVDKVFFK